MIGNLISLILECLDAHVPDSNRRGNMSKKAEKF